MRRAAPKFLVGLPLWQVDMAGAALVCLAAGVWYFAGVEPMGRVRAERQALEAELTSQREIAHTKAKLAARQDRELKKKEQQISQSDVRLEGVEKINTRVSALTGAADESGLRVDEIKPSVPRVMSRFTVVPIRLSGVGKYPAVVGFFESLRNRFRDVGVTGFKLSQREGEGAAGGEADLRFELELVWYAQPPSVPAKKN